MSLSVLSSPVILSFDQMTASTSFLAGANSSDLQLVCPSVFLTLGVNRTWSSNIYQHPYSWVHITILAGQPSIILECSNGDINLADYPSWTMVNIKLPRMGISQVYSHCRLCMSKTSRKIQHFGNQGPVLFHKWDTWAMHPNCALMKLYSDTNEEYTSSWTWWKAKQVSLLLNL